MTSHKHYKLYKMYIKASWFIRICKKIYDLFFTTPSDLYGFIRALCEVNTNYNYLYKIYMNANGFVRIYINVNGFIKPNDG